MPLISRISRYKCPIYIFYLRQCIDTFCNDRWCISTNKLHLNLPSTLASLTTFFITLEESPIYTETFLGVTDRMMVTDESDSCIRVL